MKNDDMESPGLSQMSVSGTMATTAPLSFGEAQSDEMETKPDIHQIAVLDSNCPYQAHLDQTNVGGMLSFLVKSL